jgi:hypothetical protein
MISRSALKSESQSVRLSGNPYVKSDLYGETLLNFSKSSSKEALTRKPTANYNYDESTFY